MNENYQFPFFDHTFKRLVETDWPDFEIVLYSYGWCRIDKLGKVIEKLNSLAN